MTGTPSSFLVDGAGTVLQASGNVVETVGDPAGPCVWDLLVVPAHREAVRLAVQRARHGGRVELRCVSSAGSQPGHVDLVVEPAGSGLCRVTATRATATGSTADAPILVERPADAPTLLACGWCTAIYWPPASAWLPYELAVREPAILGSLLAPLPLSHGICPKCALGLVTGSA